MAKDKSMEIIQVVFNTLDPDQQQLFRHAAGRTNRSGYIKRLIQRDMDGAAVIGYKAALPAEEEINDFNAEGFI